MLFFFWDTVSIRFMKIISWNVNGFRAWIKKEGVLNFLKKEKPDILCLQEIKANEEQIEKSIQETLLTENYLSSFPFRFWNSAEKKGYSGTGVLSKREVKKVWQGMKNSPILNEGRILNVEFDTFILVNVYTPNSKPDLSRLSLRYNEWDTLFLSHLKELERKKPLIVCGDFNVAHKEIDLARPEANRTRENYPGNAGFTDQERERFNGFLKAGFVDIFRFKYPKKVQYSWWSYRARAREKNVGWRIDYFLLSPSLVEKVRDVYIYDKQTGSDHAPIALDILM